MIVWPLVLNALVIVFGSLEETVGRCLAIRVNDADATHLRAVLETISAVRLQLDRVICSIVKISI